MIKYTWRRFAKVRIIIVMIVSLLNVGVSLFFREYAPYMIGAAGLTLLGLWAWAEFDKQPDPAFGWLAAIKTGRADNARVDWLTPTYNFWDNTEDSIYDEKERRSDDQ